MNRAWVTFTAVVVAGLVLGGCTTKSRMHEEIAVRESKISELESDIQQKSDDFLGTIQYRQMKGRNSGDILDFRIRPGIEQ